jgi:Predicted endonuclease distantly related to archaeal Holliday junction resolvase and Mrr-like restriction enzymes
VSGYSDIKSKVQELSPSQFESLVATVWSEMGWSVEVTQESRDRGVDIVANKTGIVSEKVVIQAKCYAESNKVGRPAIQQYNTLRQQEPDVDSVIVVTSSSFTSEATKLAQKLGVKTVNGTELAEAYSNHLSQNQISTQSDTHTPKSGNQNKLQGVSADELNEAEYDFAEMYEQYLQQCERTQTTTNQCVTLLLNIETEDTETSTYVIEYGSLHKIKFPSNSPKLLAQLQQTAKKYGWEVLDTEINGIGPGGVEMVVPPEDGEMFYLAVDTSPNTIPEPARQAKIVSLIFDRVYEQDLSGTEATCFGPTHSNESFGRVLIAEMF